MAKITVSTHPTTQRDASVVLDESVHSTHLSDEDNAAELIERLGWAITDAENAESASKPL